VIVALSQISAVQAEIILITEMTSGDSESKTLVPLWGEEPIPGTESGIE
jgi:hypothetical protein